MSALTSITFPLLVLLTIPDGIQNVPEAFAVASAEIADKIQFWQDPLGSLEGQLESLAGAKVLSTNNRPPFDAVNSNAAIAGTFQALTTLQNGYC
ncbi:hypothetical protein H2248_012379 [Termitomyces sp. 'cryptogamus']|nr:hypothetical protein H2248_012379 [Termitomyces sp. 'cryptogamus']